MDYLSAIWQEIVARPDGPMSFRVYLQPAMSTIYAIISGLKDAREGKPAYFWSMFTDPSQRDELVRDGWKSVRNVFLLAIVPYLVVRGPVSRLARWFGVGASAGTNTRRRCTRGSTISRGAHAIPIEGRQMAAIAGPTYDQRVGSGFQVVVLR